MRQSSCFAFGQEIENRDMDMELCKREMCTWLIDNNCLLLHITTDISEGVQTIRNSHIPTLQLCKHAVVSF